MGEGNFSHFLFFSHKKVILHQRPNFLYFIFILNYLDSKLKNAPMQYSLFEKVGKLSSKLEKPSTGNWIYGFVILIFAISSIFIPLTGKIGCWIIATSSLILYILKVTRPKVFNSKRISYLFGFALIIGNTLFCYSLFDNFGTAFITNMLIGYFILSSQPISFKD